MNEETKTKFDKNTYQRGYMAGTRRMEKKVSSITEMIRELYGVFARHFGDWYGDLTEDEKELLTEIKEMIK